MDLMKPLKKRGQLGSGLMVSAAAFAIGLVVVVLVTGFGAEVLSDINTGQTANSAEANVTNNGLTGMLNFSSQFGNIGTIGAIVIIILLLIGGLGFFLRGR